MYKEIKHLTMLKDVKQVVQVYEVFELNDQTDVHIVMEVQCCHPPLRRLPAARCELSPSCAIALTCLHEQFIDSSSCCVVCAQQWSCSSSKEHAKQCQK